MTVQKLKLLASLQFADRRYANSTEFFLLIESNLPEFWVAIAHRGTAEKVMGYLRYVRGDETTETILGRPASRFELREMLPASSPAPYPIVSLSGVLWNRMAAIEAHRSISSFLEGEDQIGEAAVIHTEIPAPRFAEVEQCCAVPR